MMASLLLDDIKSERELMAIANGASGNINADCRFDSRTSWQPARSKAN